MNFDELASTASTILADRGYQRLNDQAGWFWEHGRSRIQFANTPETGFHFPYSILRQRYDTNQDGVRVLLPQASLSPVEANADAVRVADLIQSALDNPF